MAWSSSNRRKRLPRGWRTIRQQVLERDEGICYVCRRSGATEVDHIRRGDDHSLTNLAAIHILCHQAKTQREAALAHAQRHRQKRPPEQHPGLK